jgi:trimeric autotransporter adhesin
MPARKNRRAGQMSQLERKIMKNMDALRNSGNRSFWRRGSVFIPLGLFALLAVSPTSRAVTPPPDGGYPNFTTAEGQNALFNLTTGAANTAVGWRSLFSDTTGSFNTGVGAGALILNNGDNNTATGAAALLFNTTGADNAATGVAALLSNTVGGENTATGAFALNANTEGDVNTANGTFALYRNTTGEGNTAVGALALAGNTTGDRNTAVGHQALSSASAFAADGNTAVGDHALFNNTVFDNTAIGASALQANSEGVQNTATGLSALSANTTGSNNTAVGSLALSNNTTGLANIALGFSAGGNITTAAHVICIGADGANVDNSCFIGNIFGQTSASGAGVYVNSNNKLGTLTSSSRFKDDIKPMKQASEALFALKPVTFHYKKEMDPAGMQQFGLVAEEVEKVNPDLIVRDKEGKPYSVRYDQVNAMLLNEFLKEHRTVQEQKATIAQLEKGMKTVIARLDEQDSKIEKVNTQVAVSKPAPQIVDNNQ